MIETYLVGGWALPSEKAPNIWDVLECGKPSNKPSPILPQLRPSSYIVFFITCPQLCQPVETVSAFIVDVHIVRQVVSHAFSVPWEVFVEGSSIGRVALPPEDGEKRQLMLGRMLTEPLMNSWEISWEIGWEISGNINIFKVEAPTLKTIAVSFNHRPRWKCRNLTLGARHSTQPCTMGLIRILLHNMWVESPRSPCRRSNLPLSRPVSGSYFHI